MLPFLLNLFELKDEKRRKLVVPYVKVASYFSSFSIYFTDVAKLPQLSQRELLFLHRYAHHVNKK